MPTRQPDQRSTAHAVVIGGSMAGLLAARVLSDHFARVTLIERDAISDDVVSRKGVPQGRHAHGLLAHGLTAMLRWFPNLDDDLVRDGAVASDMALGMRWFQLGSYKLQFESGFPGVFMSRPLLETHVRRRVLALPNVAVRTQWDVEGLVTSEDRSRVTGVKLRDLAMPSLSAEIMLANLVIDTTGRGSRSPQWLEALGYGRVEESVVKIDVAYATRLYRRKPNDLVGAEATIVSPTPPKDKRVGVMFPIEGDRWILTLGGWCGDHAPSDDAGFLEFARSLAAPDIYNIIRDAEPVSEVMLHKFPSNLRRHYERMQAFPDGYLVLGDAISSFNPLYGQGMTASSLEAQVLERMLGKTRGTLDGFWRQYFKGVAKVVDIPWTVASGGDFNYPEVEGVRPPGTALINRYIDQVHRAAAQDPEVYRAFLFVMNLQKAPPSVMAPTTMFRVARAAWQRRSAQKAGALRVALSR